MNVDILQIMNKAGELLVSQGYGHYLRTDTDGVVWISTDPEKSYEEELVDPFDDTLDGIHQLNALEDWFISNKRKLLNTVAADTDVNDSNHIRRREAIFSCIEIIADAENRSHEITEELKRRTANGM